MRNQRVFVGLAALAFAVAINAQTAQAQQDPAAQSSPAPQSQQPSPSTPSAPSPSSPSLGSAQAATTITGELKDVDTKTKTITLKTTVGPDMKFKYDDSTKISGSTRGAAGLSGMTGQQVTISYKKDGQSNMISSIDVASATNSPSSPRTGDRPGSPSDRPGSEPTSPRTPGSDPSSPTSPRTPGSDPTSPRTPGSPDSPSSPQSPRP